MEFGEIFVLSDVGSLQCGRVISLKLELSDVPGLYKTAPGSLWRRITDRRGSRDSGRRSRVRLGTFVHVARYKCE